MAYNENILDSLTFGFLGGGNMASALMEGLISRGVPATSICVAVPSENSRNRLATRLGVHATETPDATFANCDVIVLAVKPQQLRDAIASLKPFLNSAGLESLVISVVAGARLHDLQRWLGQMLLVRAMPNTPALVRSGMTGLAATPEICEQDRNIATAVMEAVGRCIWVESDDQIDAVTALSGSGPAYIFYFMEAMEYAALELGLNAEQGRTLALETFRGATALVAHSSESLATLRERVTSKGGTTHAAINSMDTDRVQAAFIRALHAAAERGREMGLELGLQ
ncbi:pyrroline-5-carboxylate reductase [Pseudomonas grandcourensis]|uniref:pyrroline-5-carboxylate reductase n=1 Tax=Pseudomonas grandcourensis TaxID=3136736 RepID=UPI0032649396